MYRTSTTEPIVDDAADLNWTLALAGGEGVCLSDYVQQRFGARIPKQYCSLLGERSMLQQTLGRMNVLAPASRTLTVIGTHHAELAMPQLEGTSDHVVRQPSSRDTGFALYIALAFIKRWNPNAIVTVTPTDHYVAPSSRYIEQVRAAQTVARRLRDRVVILGVEPTEADPALGYLTLGASLSEIPDVRAVSGFVEKPSTATAEKLVEQGAVWSTMVVCGSVDALWELGRAAEPQLMDILDSLVPLVGTPDEDDALEYIYRAYLPVSFSRDMLERAPERLAAMTLDGVEWSDLGGQTRVESVIARRANSLRSVTWH
jgi:mannose-1-phosphate guanylyltransferase